MSRWGMTGELRDTRPWGLPKELLAPGKVITDPIHRDIHMLEIEVQLLNSAPLQRLRRVRQLGTSNLVYPGATHSRLSHSLGAMFVAQSILDVVESQRSGPKPIRDLFAEWEEHADASFPYQKRLAEAVVLGRLGGLLHDLCHVPYGHTLEDDLGLLEPHDENITRFDKIWEQLPALPREAMEAGGLKEALMPLILSKCEGAELPLAGELPSFIERPASIRYPFVRDVVGNTICADLIDYLQRDHYMAGLPASLGHRFLDGFFVAPSGTHCQERMVMRIARGERERADIVTELFKYLRYRYEETERVLVHHAKLSADAMIGKLLSMLGDELLLKEIVRKGVVLTDDQLRDVDLSGVPDAELAGARMVAREALEQLFLRCGDDGVLEHLASTYGTEENSRQQAIGALAEAVLNRDLYKLIGRAPTTAGMTPEDIYMAFGSPDTRRAIERRVAKFAGLSDGWRLLLWVPHPKMRLKPADVLVTSDGRTIQPLKSHEKHGQQGSAIEDLHKKLWAVSVYVPRDVAQDEELCSAILGELSKEMRGLRWEGHHADDRDAEAAIARTVSNRGRLTRVEEQHIGDSLRTGQAAALTRRSDEGAAQPLLEERSYANLMEQAEAFAIATSERDRAASAPADLAAPEDRLFDDED